MWNEGTIVLIIFGSLSIIFIIIASVIGKRKNLIQPENLEVVIKYDAQYYKPEDMHPYDYFNINVQQNRKGKLFIIYLYLKQRRK